MGHVIEYKHKPLHSASSTNKTNTEEENIFSLLIVWYQTDQNGYEWNIDITATVLNKIN